MSECHPLGMQKEDEGGRAASTFVGRERAAFLANAPSLALALPFFVASVVSLV